MISPASNLLTSAKWLVYTTLGFFTYHFAQRKKIVIVLSSMRSGSTLLKSLMGQAQDVSLLDEFHFIPYANHNKYFFYHLVSRLSDKPIVVLKKPFNNVSAHLPLYGKTPLADVLNIVLCRHPYETLLSLKAMQRRKNYPVFSDEECVKYWCDTYEAIFDNIDTSRDTLFVQYEKLTSQPAEETRRIFEFIGSTQQGGVNGYREYAWKPGLDDDSDKVRSGTIHKAEAANPEIDSGLYAAINNNSRIEMLLVKISQAISNQRRSAQ